MTVEPKPTKEVIWEPVDIIVYSLILVIGLAISAPTIANAMGLQVSESTGKMLDGVITSSMAGVTLYVGSRLRVGLKNGKEKI